MWKDSFVKSAEQTNVERRIENPQPVTHRIIGRCEELTYSELIKAIEAPVITITDFSPTWKRGGRNDYHSEADYWWPKGDGSCEYQRTDGLSNPETFGCHRRALRDLKYRVSLLLIACSGFGLRTAEDALNCQLRAFFVDPETRMLPHLKYAQGIPGHCTGRTPGVIDGLHLAEVALALHKSIRVLSDKRVLAACRAWFHEYFRFLSDPQWGRIESLRENNHATAYWLQFVAVALFIRARSPLLDARKWLADRCLPHQMSQEGSFPSELSRTKPYGYSLFQVNCLALLYQTLNLGGDESVWEVALPDGRGLQSAVNWIWPFMKEPEKWPFPQDVQYFDAWRVRQPALFIAGTAFGNSVYLDHFFQSIDRITEDEVDRNSPALCLPIWGMHD
jgi:hypothetical protein